VTVRHTNPVTGEETFDLILVDGSWVLDGETLFGQLGPAEQQALDAAPAMYEAMRGVAQRVRAGEFSSVQEASQALLAVIMNAANQGGGLQPPG
ncbi:MAG: hypothetical protein SYC29_15630, partial [Planctomycetota bacterium]|nr:hypothetical protein [Planctomycetota bacterium]